MSADQLYAGRFFYILYFIRPGEPEADFGADLRGALKRVYFALSGDAPLNCWLPDAPRDAALLPLLPNPPDGPLSFITDADLDAIAASFEHTGMIGAFNRYRASALDAAESVDIIGAPVTQPSCFIAGERDLVRAFIPGITAMRTRARRAPTFAAARSCRVPGTGFTKRGRPRRTLCCSRFFSRWSNPPTEWSPVHISKPAVSMSTPANRVAASTAIRSICCAILPRSQDGRSSVPAPAAALLVPLKQLANYFRK